MKVPPQLALMMPHGTPSSFCSRCAKKFATAEKLLKVCGVATCHSPFTVDCGARSARLATLIMRIWFGLAAAISAVYPEDSIDHSMLDWPEASQTSPIRMSRTSMRSAPSRLSTVSVCGPPAGSSGKRSRKRPSSPEIPSALVGPSPALMRVRGRSVQPQTGMDWWRCTTA